MSDKHPPVGHEDADDVEPVGFARPAVAVDPALGGLGEFVLLAVMHRFDRIAERRAGARLHFDEGDDVAALDDEIDVASAGAESTRDNFPSRALEPAGGDSFAEFTEQVGGLGHAANLRAIPERAGTVRTPQGAD